MDIIAMLGFWHELGRRLAEAGARNDYFWFLRIGSGT